MKRTTGTTVPTAGALLTALGLPAGPAQTGTTPPRVDLRVLLVSDGGPATRAFTTLPAGGAFDSPYAGAVSGWTASSGSPLTFTLTAPAPAFAADASAEQPATGPAPHTTVLTDVTEQVPQNPGD